MPRQAKEGMQIIKWYASVGLVGCRITGTIEVEADADDEAIEDTIRDAVFNRVEWGRDE